MVTTTINTSNSRYRTNPGDGYDGVVRVSLGGYYGTGSLLFDGRAVLTAAHLFGGLTGSASVTFETRSGTQAENKFDTDASTLKSHLGSGMAWTPLTGSQLVADFDDGASTRDALGRLIYSTDTGRGLDEGLIAQGDSGGPAVISGLLAGVASYTASLSWGRIDPDIDASTNSSFGEIAAWQRVSTYQQWIDQSLRANYLNTPTKPEEVIKEVTEGNSSTIYAYFLIQFTGVRSDANQIISMDYTTRNGTALAGVRLQMV